MMSRIAGFAVVLLLLLCLSEGVGQEKSIAGKHDQAALYFALRDVINTGADLFNLEADYAGCFRLYQGSLLSIKPFLQADLQRNIDKALSEAVKKASYAERAHHLRTAIDAIRARIKPSDMQPPPRPPLPLPPPIFKTPVDKAPDGETIRVPPAKAGKAPLSGKP